MALRRLLGLGLSVLMGGALSAAPDRTAALKALAGDAGRVSIHRATGAVRFVRFDRPVQASTVAARDPLAQTMAFLVTHREAFGLADPARELRLTGTRREPSGATHLSFEQVYRGIPVFASMLRVHFDADGRLTAINGAVLPDLSLATTPAISRAEAARRAEVIGPRTPVRPPEPISDGTPAALTPAEPSRPGASRLVVFRTGFVRGVVGASHLAWEVQIDNGIHSEAVYVDAQTGRVLDRIPLAKDALDRRAFEGQGNYPATSFWEETDAFPTAVTDADELIDYTGDAWSFFENAFGRDSFDDAGATLDAVFHYVSGSDCYSAYARVSPSRHVIFCRGMTSDDLVAHEWMHHYTDFTHGLIYQWQPGAVNEAYSDIFGETMDLLNGKGSDAPQPVRTTDRCSFFHKIRDVEVEVTSPSAATYAAMMAGSFGTPVDDTGLSGTVVLVDDGSGTTSDGCETPFANAAAVVNNIALIDRGTCAFGQKAANAVANGAIGVIVANNIGGGDTLTRMFTDDSDLARSVTIPSVFIGYTDGTDLKSLLPGATVTVAATAATETSRRWLFGEDSTGWNGFLRDMWNPNCGAAPDPGRVGDAAYWCDSGDFGGVHHNSGVVNHTYALVTDGGTYNGRTVSGIGLTKAAHIYWRAMTTYQVPVTDFADHSDALEQSCQDLLGVDLASLTTGDPSGEILTTADCAQLALAIEATELRTPPSCGFSTLLAQDPPVRCGVGESSTIFVDTFESGIGSWTRANTGVNASWTPRDWRISGSLPGGRSGSAALAPNSASFGDCTWGSDPEAGEMVMDGPAIVLPAGSYVPMLSFVHSMATEEGWNGGNVKIDVNGGGWLEIPASAFSYNAYNTTLATGMNPNNGEGAFTGTDEGSVSATWGESIVDLSGYASPGDTIRLRFEFGAGACWSYQGWHVDDVRVYACDRISVGIVANAGATSPGAHGVTLVTSERGTSASFSVALGAQPSATVQIPVASSDTGEGSVSPALLEFTAADWDVPQLVTVTGVDDDVVDGTAAYSITLGPAQSADTAFSGQAAAVVAASNHDDDHVPIPLATPVVLLLIAAMLGVAGALALRSQ